MPKLKTVLLVSLVSVLSILMIGCAGLISQGNDNEQPLAAGDAELPEWLLLTSRQTSKVEDPAVDSDDEDEEQADEPTETAAPAPAPDPAQASAPASTPAPSTQPAQPSQSTSNTGYTGEIGHKFRDMHERRNPPPSSGDNGNNDEGDFWNLFDDNEETKIDFNKMFGQ